MNLNLNHIVRSVVLMALCACHAVADLSQEQMDAITDGLQGYRSSWTTENTLEILQRSTEEGKGRFSLTTDQGATVIVEIQEGSRILVDGVPLREGAPQPTERMNRTLLLMSVLIGLSLCLALSLILNVSLLLRGRSSNNARGTEVIRHLTRF